MNKLFLSKIGRALLILPLIVGLSSPALANEAKPTIELAILIDSSGSMSGLINQARRQIWRVVNSLSEAKKAGLPADLRVALYTHGVSAPGDDGNHIIKLAELTEDLDDVSEKLNALKTSGSQEYVGTSIQYATNQLDWSDREADFRVIFAAGNETLLQGPVKYQDGVAAAVAKDILVNAIHCKIPGDKGRVEGEWKNAAELGNGSFVQIDQNYVEHNIKSPYDATLLKLNEKLNETYVFFGSDMEYYKKRLLGEDLQSGENLVERALTKAGRYYGSGSGNWDLVEAVKQGKVKLEEIKVEHLPEEMREMSIEEMKAYLKKKGEQRERITIAIQEVSKLRREYVEKKIEELEEEQGATVASVMIKALKAQLADKGFSLE